MASPAVLTCRDGHYVPVLKKAYHKQGLNGNGKDIGRGEGWIMELRRRGFVEIPHDFSTTCFGQSRPPAQDSSYLTCHRNARGQECWTDAWEDIRQVGHRVVRDRDDEGRLQFLIDVMAFICPSGLEDWQKEDATKPRRNAINHQLRKQDGGDARLVAAHYAHLPPEHRPGGAPEPSAATPPQPALAAPKRRRKPKTSPPAVETSTES
mgnify:FL=1